MKNTLRTLTLAAAAVGLASFGAHAASTADVVFLVDESGSMGGEHTWLGTMISSLDANLVSAGVTGNRYGLVGFGGNDVPDPSGNSDPPHLHAVGGGQFGTAAEFATATGSLVTSGRWEDGWAAIDYAISNYTFRSNAAVNFILVTDEDRDNTNNALTYTSVLASMTSRGIVLNAVVNADVNGIGTDVGANATTRYLADGSGGFTTTTALSPPIINGAGTTVADYSDMAIATGGASWDLDRLRAGGNTATSFTAAFVDLKTDEIITTPTPASGSTLAFLLGSVVLLGATRRKFAKAA